jgi:1-aminocyclopropane-1-carboxylate deaminase/D-cysteine desulfhydrase-like pyridoxal-dependent ACC family enzyme
LSVKRDDMTGLAFGGNKVRQHEYVLGDAVAAGADCLIQGSASQSNHSRQLAAAGARLGLETFLLPKADERSHGLQGNYLIDHLLGATIRPIAPDESSIDAKSRLADALRAEGRHPYILGMGSDKALALAAVAYVGAACEIVEQSGADELPTVIVTASQGSTQAGLMLGFELLGVPTRVVGIAPLDGRHEAYIAPRDIAAMLHEAAGLLGMQSHLGVEDIVLIEDYVGDGYGIPDARTFEAIRVLGGMEGILLDPIYSGKAFAGLLDQVRRGRISHDEHVMFLHTGGLPALFAHSPWFEERFAAVDEGPDGR